MIVPGFLPSLPIPIRSSALPLPHVHLPVRRKPATASLRHSLLATVAALSTYIHAPQPPQPPTPSLSTLVASSVPISSHSQGNPTAIAPLLVSPQPSRNPQSALVPRREDGSYRYAAKVLLLAGIGVAVATAGTIAVFWVIQDSLVYKPVKAWRGSPGSSGMPYYDDVNYCTVDGAEISGWFIRQPEERYTTARTMVYFHGTDKNASFRLKKVIGFYETCCCNVLLLSYRGYGLSTGKPNERGVRIDAESAYDYLVSRGDVDVGPGGKLWVYGESLGGAVAIHFSNVYQKCINALILENTFTSLLDMIKLEFPMLGIFRYLSRNRWQSKKRIGDLGIPLLFLSGLKDSYIPPQMMKTMHSLATKSPLKEFVTFEKGTHNRTWAMDGFYDSVATFMDRVEKDFREGETVDSQEAVGGRGFEDGNRIATVA